MIITDEQRKELENNPRYRDLCVIAVQNYGGFIVANNGDAPPGGMPKVDWARQRIIGKDVVLHPNNQNYADWISQFTIFLRGADIWQEATGVDGTIDYMIENNVFESAAEDTYKGRMQAVQF